jgi:hypothetical protein
VTSEDLNNLFILDWPEWGRDPGLHRTFVIMVVAFLDRELEQLLRAFFIKDSKVANELLSGL